LTADEVAVYPVEYRDRLEKLIEEGGARYDDSYATSSKDFILSGVVADLIESTDVNLLAAYFADIDANKHFWQQVVTDEREYMEREKEKYDDVLKTYEEADRMIGKFLEIMDEDWNIFIVSDHGWDLNKPGPNHYGFPYQEGVFIAYGKDIKKGRKYYNISTLDVTPTIIYLFGLPAAEDMDGRVLEEIIDDSYRRRQPINVIPTYEEERKGPSAGGHAIEESLAILREHPWFMAALDVVSDMGLPQWCIGAGVIRNIVFDYLDGGSTTPIRDVDVAYFDLSDLSEHKDREYEDILKARMPDVPWEVTNQAAVHLWFHKKFGYRVPPVNGIEEAVATWPETCTAVAVTKVRKDEYKVYAPCGLEDLFGMVIRRNPERVDLRTYHARISDKQYGRRWKSIRIMKENC
jgi:hypothetical protein